MFEQLTKGLYWVKAPNGGSFPHCNCLWIKTDVNVLIDTNPGEEALQVIKAEMPEIVINTHFHEDHINNNGLFVKSEIWAPEADAPAISSIQRFADFYGFADYDMVKMGEEFIEEWHITEVPVTRELKNNEILDFGTVKLQLINLPGHTPGHSGFYEEKTGTLYTADIDLSKYGPWYGHKCSNLGDFIDSLYLCIEIEPACLISAHSLAYRENIADEIRKFMDIVYRREEAVLEKLKNGEKTLDMLAKANIIYSPRVKRTGFIDFTEKMSIEKHLEWLLEKGAIKQEGEQYLLA